MLVKFMTKSFWRFNISKTMRPNIRQKYAFKRIFPLYLFQSTAIGNYPIYFYDELPDAWGAISSQPDLTVFSNWITSFTFSTSFCADASSNLKLMYS